MESKLTILIVDDHPAMLRTLQDILEDEGYAVTTVASGRAAVQTCQQRYFDVILMDVRMPDLNGVEAFRQLKNYALGTRVIMMSAYSVEDLKQEALDEGAIAFLEKPVNIEIVLKLVQGTEQPPVLIVMDNQQERERLGGQLTARRYRTYTVGTPEDALELARQIQFHVIMIDTKLHSMSALELYLALKEITPKSVTILLSETDEAFVKQAEEVVRHSAYTFLTKPLDLDKLFAILQRIKQQVHSDALRKESVLDA